MAFIVHPRRISSVPLVLAFLVSCGLVLSAFSLAQDASHRRIVERGTPAYPALARKMALEGVVRIEAVVAPDGSVKDVAVRGGHPVLAQAAANSVRGWRWESATHESRELVEVKFAPEQ